MRRDDALEFVAKGRLRVSIHPGHTALHADAEPGDFLGNRIWSAGDDSGFFRAA